MAILKFMVQEEDSQQSLEVVREQIFTPETFSPHWNSNPVGLLDIPLNFPYSLKEWDRIFEILIGLLDHKERQIWDRAINQLIHALEMEASQHSNYDDYKPRPTHERLKSIFEAITAQTLEKPEIFAIFCSRFKFLAEKSPNNYLILEWLDELTAVEDRQAPTQEEIVAAKIFLGAYDSTWQEVGTTLLELLDHADTNIRACAAYQIGKFCSKAISSREDVWEWRCDDKKYVQDKQAVVGMPPLEAMMQLIRGKELERPGVAGAFWGVIPKKGIDAKEWLLDVLEHSQEPEPYIPYFPCDLAFDAHERFSRDADAVRRLIDMGRAGLALGTATDEPCKVATLEPVLIELGHYDDAEITRIASWQLAYYYHYLHPCGEKLKYVELLKLSEIDLFLLFRQEHELEPPYAVVIYSGTNQKLSRALAQSWVDKIFSEVVRGEPKKDLPRGNSHRYQRGYVDYHTSTPNANSNLIENVIIGYRSKFPWNPKQFL
ncbi:MAG: hypothetical protein F6K00_25160 [Leptolyngbya sp. SIOISBB]|nr:hypothetical protein [Leptolyngbya sp. SIOISBB]